MKSQLDRMNKRCISIQEMAKKLKLTDLEIRLFMIKYKIVPSSKLEQDYQECARKLFKVRKKCHFYSEMAQMTGLSLTKTRNVCKMYSIKPSKECKCVTDLNKVDVDDLINTIEKNNKVKILSNQISFIGICPKCQN